MYLFTFWLNYNNYASRYFLRTKKKSFSTVIIYVAK